MKCTLGLIKKEMFSLFFNPEEFKITGTYIWYYCICKREVWLLSRGITADQEDTNIEIGRFLHEESYAREKKEIEFAGMKFDIVKRKDGQIVIGEIKKSSRFIESAKMQLLYYLDELDRNGIKANGVLLVPEEKRREEIFLDQEAKNRLNQVVEDIWNIVCQDKPPEVVKNRYCPRCAYTEMCWA